MAKEKDETTAEVVKWLENQGYPLEMTVAAAFQKAGFSVSLSDWYKDFQTNEQREIDVTALQWSDFDKSTVLQVCWRIECKLAREKPWVIFVSTAQPEHFLPFNLLASQAYKSFLLDSLKNDDICEQLKKSTLFRFRNIGHGVTQAFTSGQDIPYKAVMSSVKSSADRVFQVTELSKLPAKVKHKYWCVTFPVIVIDGKLFEYFISTEGENLINEVQSGTLFWKGGTPADQMSALVSVVTKAGLNQFIADAKLATDTLINVLEDFNQTST